MELVERNAWVKTGLNQSFKPGVFEAKELFTMTMSVNLRADRELWKYIYLNFPFARSFHLSVLPDYNQTWAEQLYREDPELHLNLLTPRHQRIIKSIERQARMMGFKINTPAQHSEQEQLSGLTR